MSYRKYNLDHRKHNLGGEWREYNLKGLRLRSLLKQKDNVLFKRYEIIWDFALKNYLKFMNIDNHTDHGENHVLNIEKRVYSFLTEEAKKKLTAFDVFALLVSCCLHDIGMIIKKGSKETNQKIRLCHPKRGQEIIEEKYLEFQLDKKEAEVIGVIVYGHGIADLKEIEAYDYWSIDSHGKVNVLFLTSLLRLGDLFDLTFLRAPKLVADLKKIKGISLNHWKLHDRISDVKFDNKTNEITIFASLNNEYDLSELYNLRNWIKTEVEIIKSNLKHNSILLSGVNLRTSLDNKTVLPALNPFLRLDFYPYEYHNAFFGRDDEIKDLYDKVTANKLSILIGKSGVGKTSLLNAGVKQKLIEDGYYVFTFRSSENFLQILFNTIKKELFSSYSIKNDIFELLRKISRAGMKIVIFYDQFEEIFTFHEKRLERDIVNFYKTILNDDKIDLKSVLSIREDFSAQLWDLSIKVPEFYDTNYTYRLKPFSREQSKQVIKNTFKHVGHSIEDDLVKNMIDDFTIHEETIYPTFIQIVCHKIVEFHRSKYKENSKNVPVRLTDYEFLKRAQNIILEYFEEILDGFTFVQREVINEILTQMITHFETKKRIKKTTISKINNNRIDIDKTLRRLIDHIIIRKIETERDDEYEIIHDILARKIIDNKNIFVSSSINKALDFIENNYTKPHIRLVEVASEAGYSSEHFCRLFKKEKGVGFIEYVNSKRINDAKRILKNPSLKVSEVFKKVGFTNQQHFTKIFKKVTGCSPNSYRKAS